MRVRRCSQACLSARFGSSARAKRELDGRGAVGEATDHRVGSALPTATILGSNRNLGNFLRQLALPRPVQTWTLTTLRAKLIKIGAKVVRHAKAITFQMAEVAVPRKL